jgi:methane/ammonia monooxygenase subunit C
MTLLTVGWLEMLGIGIFWVLFQRIFGYSHGLDSMTPEFDSVWMGLWRFNILANAVFFVESDQLLGCRDSVCGRC